MIKNQKIKNSDIVMQSQGNIVSDMDGEKVMLSISNGKYYNLGKVGGDIWELMKEPISISELVTILQAQYNVEQKECEEQVSTFLNELMEEGLVTIIHH